MAHRFHLLGVLALSGALGSTACGRAVNLLNADQPRFLGSYAPADPPAEPASAPIRVVTFNIKEGKEIDRAIAVLQGDSVRDADVVALQEMDETGVNRIARALKLNYAYYPAVIHPATKGYYGPAVLTRWPIERSWKVMLPYESWGRKQRRTATAAIVRINGLPVAVYAVHLETMVKLSDTKRAEQAKAVTDDAKRYRGPVVILGDFNDPAMAARMERQGFTWTTEWVGPTHMGLFTLDHIMTRGLSPAAPASVGVVQDVDGASDHHPVWAVLEPESPTSLGLHEAAAAPAHP
jgi:endonuclease/exonuclease/phosphatase family metal-dependent hydrolase